MPIVSVAARTSALALALVAGQASAQSSAFVDPTIGVNGSDLCAHSRVMFHEEHAPEMLRAVTGAGDTDVLHNDLDIEIDHASNFLGGSNTLTVRSTVDGLSTMQVRLRENYTITSVTVNGAAASWTRLSLTTIEVTLPVVMNTDDVFDLYVEYSGTPVNVGFGSINYTTHSGSPIVFTLSEPWYAYSWWPNKDDNRDKATADIRITAPSSMSVASNGSLISETSVGGGRTATQWSATTPMATYLLSMSATNYNRFSATYNHPGGSMPLEFYIYPESDTTANRNAWLEVIPMLDVFTNLYGPYPFLNEKYGIYQFNFGGGMEHQTMTGQGGFGLSLSAHELAHQWWGNDVTCATWSDIWLNEGFATYSEALWEEFKIGGTEADLHAAMAARRPTSFNSSTYIPSPTNPSRIFSSNFTYRKGAWIMHMLRHVIGDSDFFNALDAYRADCTGASATTEDFRASVESVVGQDLSWFFDQWVYGVGAPHYEHAWVARSADGVHYADIFLRQAQPASYEPVFTMPITFEVETVSGTTLYVADNDEAQEHIVLRTSEPIINVTFDPFTWILAESSVTVPYQESPPRIVGANVDPDGELLPTQPIHVTFHKDVNVSVGDISLLGPSGSVAFSIAYNAPSQVLEITPDAPLEAGAHVLTIADSVTDLASAQALDGEVPMGVSGASLLTGDGLAGGDAVFNLSVPSLGELADFDDSGAVDGADLAILLAAWGAAGSPADLTGDGVVDGADLAALLAAWGPVA